MVEGTSLAVHRCRFVDFSPSAITALCFPPLPLPSLKGKKKATSRKALRFGTLAVGRANGNIELCEWTGSDQSHQAPQAWVVSKTLSGPYPSKADSLAFAIKFLDQVGEDETPDCTNLRLFSTGGSSELVEWDLEAACIRRTVSSQGGSIWCIAPNPASTVLALGCEDGAIRLLSIEDDTLTHIRRLDRVKTRILSVAWGPPVPRGTNIDGQTNDAENSDNDDDDDDWLDSWLVAGCADSSLRKWDVANGRVLDRMGTDKIRGERTLVWAVVVLGDGTIVSGDSMGIVKFWDPLTCTQLDSFSGHVADVLCLAISPEGTAVYSSGVDQRVIQYTHIKTTRAEATSSLLARPKARWVQSTLRRLHSHDVRGLAIWPPHTPLATPHQRKFPIDLAPILASGGLDMSVTVTPAALAANTITKVINPLDTSTTATFEDSYHRRLAYCSGPYHASALHLAYTARLLLCMRDAGISVWRILRRQNPLDLDEIDGQSPDGGWVRVLDMELNANTNLVASAISDDGRWIAVADWYETKLFELLLEKNGDIKPRRIRNFTTILSGQLPESTVSTGASSLIFTPDSSKLIIATAMSSYIIFVDLGSDSRPPHVLRKFEHHRVRDVLVGGRVVKGKPSRVSRNDNDLDVDMSDINANANAAAETYENEEFSYNAQGTLLATVTRMATSADGQWLATTDARRRTHVFNLDSVQHHTQLPTFPAPIHALAFDPAEPNVLVLGLANNTLQVYDVEARVFPRWARALCKAVPHHFAHLHDPIIGVTFDPASVAGADGEGKPRVAPRSALFWGATWLCRAKLDEAAGSGVFEKRRRRKGGIAPPDAATPSAPEEGQAQTSQRNFRIATHYRPMLFVDFIDRNELVVVERPLVDVLAGLPPAFFKPKYGRT